MRGLGFFSVRAAWPEYDIASLFMVGFYCFVTKACARRPGAAASMEHRRRERRALLAGAAAGRRASRSDTLAASQAFSRMHILCTWCACGIRTLWRCALNCEVLSLCWHHHLQDSDSLHAGLRDLCLTCLLCPSSSHFPLKTVSHKR
jgi:hypothetical protein